MKDIFRKEPIKQGGFLVYKHGKPHSYIDKRGKHHIPEIGKFGDLQFGPIYYNIREGILKFDDGIIIDLWKTPSKIHSTYCLLNKLTKISGEGPYHRKALKLMGFEWYLSTVVMTLHRLNPFEILDILRDENIPFSFSRRKRGGIFLLAPLSYDLVPINEKKDIFKEESLPYGGKIIYKNGKMFSYIDENGIIREPDEIGRVDEISYFSKKWFKNGDKNSPEYVQIWDDQLLWRFIKGPDGEVYQFINNSRIGFRLSNLQDTKWFLTDIKMVLEYYWRGITPPDEDTPFEEIWKSWLQKIHADILPEEKPIQVWPKKLKKKLDEKKDIFKEEPISNSGFIVYKSGKIFAYKDLAGKIHIPDQIKNNDHMIWYGRPAGTKKMEICFTNLGTPYLVEYKQGPDGFIYDFVNHSKIGYRCKRVEGKLGHYYDWFLTDMKKVLRDVGYGDPYHPSGDPFIGQTGNFDLLWQRWNDWIKENPNGRAPAQIWPNKNKIKEEESPIILKFEVWGKTLRKHWEGTIYTKQQVIDFLSKFGEIEDLNRIILTLRVKCQTKEEAIRKRNEIEKWLQRKSVAYIFSVERKIDEELKLIKSGNKNLKPFDIDRFRTEKTGPIIKQYYEERDAIRHKLMRQGIPAHIALQQATAEIKTQPIWDSYLRAIELSKIGKPVVSIKK